MYQDCEEVREEFSALLDEELTVEEREAVESHLAECAECLRALDAFKQVTDVYANLDPVSAPADFHVDIPKPPVVKPVQFRSRTWSRKRLTPLLAAAAMLVVSVSTLFIWVGNVNGPAEPETFTLAQAPQAESVATDEGADLPQEMAVEVEAVQAPAVDALQEPSPAPAPKSVAPDEPFAQPIARSLRKVSVDADDRNVTAEAKDSLPLPQVLDAAQEEREMIASAPSPERTVEAAESFDLVNPADENLGDAVPEKSPPDSSAIVLFEAADAATHVASAEVSRGQIVRTQNDEPAPLVMRREAPEMKKETSLGRLRSRSVDSQSARMLASTSATGTEARVLVVEGTPKVFTLKAGIFTQDGYVDQPKITIKPESPQWTALLQTCPDLAPCVTWGSPVIVHCSGRWYLVQVAEKP